MTPAGYVRLKDDLAKCAGTCNQFFRMENAAAILARENELLHYCSPCWKQVQTKTINKESAI